MKYLQNHSRNEDDDDDDEEREANEKTKETEKRKAYLTNVCDDPSRKKIYK